MIFSKQILTCFLMSYSIFTFTQDTIQLFFQSEYYLSSKGYSYFYPVENHSNKLIVNEKTYEFTYPNNFNVKDTAIGLEYFKGWKNPTINNHTAILLGNYKSYKPVVYVDYNHNLNFSDDGPPLQFEKDSTIVIYLKNSAVPNAQFPIKYFYKELNPETKKIHEELFSKHLDSGNNYVPIDYWLATTRKNVRITDTLINGHPIRIGVYDGSCNGLYNDMDVDRVIFGDYETGEFSIDLADGAVDYVENVQVQIGKTVYEVVEIEPTGDYLKLIKSDNPYVKPIGLGDYIGDMEIEMISGDKKTIKQLQSPGKYLLLDFWGTWCIGCTQGLPDLQKLEQENSGVLEVLGINYGDKKKSKIQEYLQEHKVTWDNGKGSQELIDKLRVTGFPTYMLIDPNGNIVLMNGYFDEIRRIIENTEAN